MNTQQLIDAINSFAEQQIEHYTEDTDNPYAEYVTWGWTEGDIDEFRKTAIDVAEEYECERAAEYIKGLDLDGLKQLVDEYTDVEYIGDIGRNYRQLYAVPMTEVETQLPDELSAAIAELTPEQLETVKRGADEHLDGDYLYINLSYSRWALILDINTLEEFLSGQGLTLIQA